MSNNDKYDIDDNHSSHKKIMLNEVFNVYTLF